ncbi:50S ribosomal protein L25 [Patescibacteria group bacterium]|nr:50S ribosomal protein L25 [Patescibacteria group bacterium]MCL5410205.1 50S ribosomal protein L25 [Patescibacteria group bacterium]
MDKISLKATERTVLGKKVKALRREGLVPGHVFGNKVENEQVSVKETDFLKVFQQAGETGVIDLKIGAEKIRPVMIKNIQVDAVKGTPLHVDFLQVDLTKTVTVPVPLELIGEEPELVHTGEAVVIQPVNEVEVEALPADLPEKIEVDISSLQQIDDAITVADLKIGEGITILAEQETVVAKLDNAITEEMQKLMEEQAAETAEAAAAEAEAEAEEGEKAEGEQENEAEESKKEASSEEAEETNQSEKLTE